MNDLLVMAVQELVDTILALRKEAQSLRTERDDLRKQITPRSTKSDPPDDGQRVFYFFVPFGHWHVGEWRCGIGFHGRSGFCDDNDAPYWLPEPPAPQANEQEQADER